jgi:hypothetical protein
MALAICIAVDPFVLSRPPPSACPACAACPACPTCPPPIAPAPAPPPRTPIRFRVGAGLQVGLGATPSLGSLGVTVQAQLRRRVFGFGLEGRVDPRLGSAGGTVGGVGATLLMGMVVPCAHWRWLGFCALGGVGALQGTGVGVSAPRQATTFYAAVGARLAAEIPLGRVLALELHLDGLATLTRTRLELDGGEVWVTPPLSGALGATLQVRFP